ncbi:hypothetical protein BJX61DRAFT_172483 [Aspergillus egyptiacus]|nr:hypothetical protein BJX61DRAFT_172483 [Aspergillus egyptiacus]
MAYSAVSQADHELASDSDDSRGPSPQPSGRPAFFEPVPLDGDDLGAGNNLQHAKTEEDSGFKSLHSMIRSMTAASYDMVEEDDYEVVAAPPTGPDFNSASSPDLSPHPAHDAAPSENRAELRTPSTGRSIPLSHPTPGLQSLQGAYLHNVERLEKTAERLSLSSTDIGSEIRKMDLEQKRRSSGSTSYSAQDGCPPSVMSRRGSIQSVARLAQVSEQQALEEVHGDSSTRPPVHSFLPPPPEPVAMTDLNIAHHVQYHADMKESEIERPPSAASGDTYRQAGVLFNDFDGVHYVPIDKGSDIGRRLSLNRPPLASRSESYKRPQEGENMVYYPAPVPMMLNLPPKLSQRPDQAQRDKRRTQLLNVVSPENRKSAPWLSEQDQHSSNDRRRTKHLSDLPSQLRASVFFEPPSTSLDIDLTQTSAVATLDSILDASTTAPVTAFTDHPFAGPMGSEVYGSSKNGKLSKKQRPKSTLGLGQQPSSPNFGSNSLATHNLHPITQANVADVPETASLRRRDGDSSSGTGTESDSEEGSGSSEDEVENDGHHYTGPPATLLAELEKRKHDLKQRRRTAANAVGMHSTLLQLEAVAAKQSEHRRQKPVALAWENPEAHTNMEDDDEDVPLGMLFPEKAQATDETRPLGLLEKKELEESEPLSKRRARLRGEPLPQMHDQRPMTMHSQFMQGQPAQNPEDDSGDEGETLGQRIRRLKGHQRSDSKADTDFTTEILSEFDHLKEDKTKDGQGEPSQEEETLAQRRARLKKEADAKRNSGLKIPRYRRSMADILHEPRPSNASRQSLQQDVPARCSPVHQRSFDNQSSMQPFLTNAAPPKTAGGFSPYHTPSMASPYGYGMAHPNTFYSDAVLGGGHLSYATPNSFHPNAMRQVIDPGQRAVIDRWRQSIV